ncbi:39S ribosomal protein L19, mitochondrial [Geodia barretti]|uniref:Large ribosomal subunit protein bL19m n=1 Tax=Geodia barretti TaxID=519541 RepID=A0AA35U1L4_GEOBA|nr:39S ribosomal protein L19, mitochondrial [Geodia barretti]
MAGVCCMHSRLIHRAALGGVLYRRWLSSGKDSLSTASNERVPTTTHVTVNDTVCHTPKEASTNLLNFLNQSDIQKRRRSIDIPFFTAGSYPAVTRADPYSPTDTSKFVGICIARRNKSLGSTFILRNVLSGVGVEMMYELYSPAIREIQVLKLQRRRQAKLYYLRD